jgi:hypothetical protein
MIRKKQLYKTIASPLPRRILVLIAVLAMLPGCASLKPVYSFSPYAKPDGSTGMRDSYADTTEEEASKLLSHQLHTAGLCPNGWHIEKYVPTSNDRVTTREIKCN